MVVRSAGRELASRAANTPGCCPRGTGDAPPAQSHPRRTDGPSINPQSVTAVVIAPCPNVALAPRQLTQLVERCNTTSKPEPIHCAIAAYRGSWDRPDIGFADAVRATVEEGNAPNVDLPKDAYFDAGDIASDMPTRKPHAALSTPASKPDDRTHGWSSALFPTKLTNPNGPSAGEQNGDRAAEEARLTGPAAAAPEASKAPIDSLFVPRSSQRSS